MSDTYHLLSYNVRRDTWGDGRNRWRRRRDRVAARVRPADVAGLQEVRWRMLRDLVFGAPHHRWIGAGRGNGRRSGEHVPVFWGAERFVAVDHGHFWLSSTPGVPGSRDHPRAITRMATWVRLQERRTEQRLFVLNTHLDHRVEEARVEAAAQIRATLDELAGDEPVVLTADLNAPPGSEAHRLLTAHGGHRVELADAFTLAPVREGPDTTTNGFEAPRPGKRIDVVLLSPHWTVLAHRIDASADGDGYPSDHFPVGVHAALP
jgi:endonuclease/exonuclease/phosphatase family metal-dependent hydrolase